VNDTGMTDTGAKALLAGVATCPSLVWLKYAQSRAHTHTHRRTCTDTHTRAQTDRHIGT
jgi:hypothetical protein